MKIFIPLSAIALLCVACSDVSETHSDSKENTVEKGASKTEPKKVTDGRLVMSALDKVSEPNACILPLTLTNGTGETAKLSMMQFDVTGPGESASGNMFGQNVAPGETQTVRLLFPSRQCEDLRVVDMVNLKCETNGTDCAERVVFEALPDLSFTKSVSE